MLLAPVGQSIPAETPHAVSVSLPTWKSNVGYEEGQEWVITKMETGYPRFFIHKSITRLAELIVADHGKLDEQAMLFPSRTIANRCLEFFRSKCTALEPHQVRVVEFVPNPAKGTVEAMTKLSSGIAAVIFPKQQFGIAKAFWQHSGDGVSSRRAEFCERAYLDGALLVTEGVRGNRNSQTRMSKGPRRYRNPMVNNASPERDGQTHSRTEPLPETSAESQEFSQFVEERFGRNLAPSFVSNAKLAIKRRIAGSLTSDGDLHEALQTRENAENVRQVKGISEDDVYLYPTGMSSIFNTHRTLMKVRGEMKSICYGFPYIDTLKILEKWGPGCIFYGNSSSEELDDLESRLQKGDKILALFCEFPGNPLLKCPDLRRIRRLADTYDFAVVVDETVGNFLNVHVLPMADVVVSSLTKVFSGDSNVMGGSSVLNPQGRYYETLKKTMEEDYEDNYWAEDAIFLERNSRDFVTRIERININAEAICEVLRSHPRVKEVYYPKFSPTRPYYDDCRTPNGGYGGLLSITFYSRGEAVSFFDALDTAKGPSLGTNFTLSSPYTLLAHYCELDWAAQFGVEANLVRVSVGLEDTADLVSVFKCALDAMNGA